MRYAFIRVLFVAVIGQSVLPVMAQTVTPNSFTHPFMQRFMRKDYDAGTQNWIVRQDQRGVVYVGNGQGLLEYDGANWRLIRVNNTTVRTVEIAGDNTVYVAGTDELGLLQPDSLGLLQFQSLLSHVPEDDRDFGTVWFVHETPEGLYFQAGGHLFRWDGAQMDVWRPPTRFNTSAVVRDTLYVSSYGEGLLRMAGDSLTLIPGSEQFATEWIFVMLPYDASRILVGTRDQGFFLFDGKTFEPFPTEVDEFLLKYTLYLPGAVLNDGAFALGTSDAGLLVLDREGRLVHHIGRDEGLPSERIYYVFQDLEQGLWLALNNGLVRLELPAPLSFIDAEMGIAESISSLAMYRGGLFIGARDGLYVLEDGEKEVQRIAGADKTIWNLLVTSDALFATTNGGIYRIDEGRRRTSWDFFEETETGQYLAYSIHQSRLDPGILFVGRRDGLDVVRYDADDPRVWEILGSIEGIDEQVNTMHELMPGALTIGWQDGVAELRYTEESLLSPDIRFYGEEEGLPGGSVWGYRAAGRLLFTAHDGIYTYDAASTAFVRADSLFPGISFEDAVAFTNFSDGQNGEVWVASRDGVYLALPDGRGKFSVESAPFLRAADWTINSITSGPDGVVWLGGIDGLVRYDAGVIKDYMTVCTPLLERIAVGEDSVIFGGYGAPVSPPADEAPAFAFENNTIRFDYHAPLYDLPERIEYQSRLEGFNADWSPWSDDTWRTYTNLHQGSYIFRVRVKNAYGAISEPAAYAFTILAPWWATPWAYLGYALLLSGGIYLMAMIMRRRLIARERLRAEREKAEAIAATNNELQRALKHLTEAQDQLIHAEKMASLGQLTAGIAHEIKNPLNFVNNFAEISQEQTNEIRSFMEKYLEEVNREEVLEIKEILSDLHFNVAKINEHGRRADGIVSSMLDHSRTGKGERRPIEINKLIDEYLNLSYHGVRARLDNIRIDVNREYDPEIGAIEITAQEIGRVLINLLDNAFYAVAQKQKLEKNGFVPKVSVQTKRNGQFVEIYIRDNGIGVPEKIKDRIFEPFFTTKPTGSGTGLGLSLSHDIVVNGHGGDLSIHSVEGEGTTVILMLPVLP